MPRRAFDTQGPARVGRALVRAELECRGATVREVREGGVHFLEISGIQSGRSLRVRVKTRRSGTWQASASDSEPSSARGASSTLWVFVDLSTATPAFFIARDNAVRRDIEAHHRAYLAKHGGRRRDNNTSNHHAIGSIRVERLNEGWVALGL